MKTKSVPLLACLLSSFNPAKDNDCEGFSDTIYYHDDVFFIFFSLLFRFGRLYSLAACSFLLLTHHPTTQMERERERDAFESRRKYTFVGLQQVFKLKTLKLKSHAPRTDNAFVIFHAEFRVRKKEQEEDRQT